MRKLLLFVFLYFTQSFYSQISPNDTIRVENRPTDSISATVSKSEAAIITDIELANSAPQKPKFSPTKAGLYSAVLPGLGQVYNKRYWKVPIVLGAIGTGVGFIVWNDRQYKRYRNAFVAELNGIPHEFSDKPWIDKVALGNIQDQAKRQRDYAIAITGLVYILGIVDAVVDAHLYEGRKDPDLALRPTLIYDNQGTQLAKAGISLNYSF
ncbi:DUF5683 domain-containing protein [Chryseobacterium sp.]|uniref:DUF5683 domain-containing protein n=1 Tax=Chryseobacterium sp. TaxID=1871047 RepID=UPI0011C87736|nr:DUF5683 domain-containing protein [Chryseobacterium sp.]TXF75000.1 hypothetical protein FUA25_12020 [Chryseobacterium sp.]